MPTASALFSSGPIVAACTAPLFPASETYPTYAVLLRADGGTLVKITASSFSAGACTFQAVPIAFPALPPLVRGVVGASVIPVRYRTISLVGQALMADWHDSPPADLLDPADRPHKIFIADDVAGFELAFGYDPPTRLGTLPQDLTDPSMDFWLYNSPAEFSHTSADAFGSPPAPTFANPLDLRGVSIAIALQAPSHDGKEHTALLPSGRTVTSTPGRLLFVAHGTTGLRSGR